MPSPQKISSDDLIRSENGSYLFNNKSYSTASETLNAYIEKHTGYTINDASHYHYYLPSVLLASTPVRNKSMVEENKPNIHVYSRAAKDHDSINKFAINQTKLRSQQSPQSYPEKVFSANKGNFMTNKPFNYTYTPYKPYLSLSQNWLHFCISHSLFNYH